MIRRIRQLILVIVSTLAMQSVWAEDRAVVLVAAVDSPLQSLSMLTIRKVYLGIPVVQGGEYIRAVRRRDDARLNEIFMQVVVAMSDRSYERRLLSLTLKFAAPRPIEVDSLDALTDIITADAARIGYMWEHEAKADARLKILRVLWQET